MRVWLAIPALLGALLDGASGAELTEAEFQRLQALLSAPTEAAWRTIPWKLSLLDAREQAARENKPIFIWAMDGHPLGCT